MVKVDVFSVQVASLELELATNVCIVAQLQSKDPETTLLPTLPQLVSD